MTWVGLDVHARSTHAAAIDRESGELTRARFGAGVEEVVAWLQALPQPIDGCCEAGPTGSALYRATEAAALRVDVVAPSKTPRASADRVKSDRKDAELLVRLLLAGSLSAVAVPPASFEAARDLARAREQVRADLARLRHRVSKLLLRYGRVDGGGTWTQAHRQWLAAQRFEHVPTELAYLDTLAAIDGLLARRESETRGSITKTGSSFARRILVEAAWHYLREPRIGVTLHNRQAGQPDHILQIAWRAQHRLYRLHQRLRARGKPGNIAVVATARELACFLWAAAVAD
jgi:transposase